MAAELDVQAGQLEQARHRLGAAIAKHPSPAEQVWLALALAQLAEQEEAWPRTALNLQRALLLLKQSGRDAPGLEATMLNTLGVCWLEQKKLDEAARTLEHAQALRLGLLMRAQARFSAQGEHESSLEASPAGGIRQYNLAEQETLPPASRHSPEQHALVIVQARLSGAVDAPSLQAAQAWLANTTYNLGVTQARQARWLEASQSLEQAASLYSGPERVQTQLDLVRLLHEGGVRQLALEALQAVEQDQLSPLQVLERQALEGLIWAGLGRVTEGTERLKQVITAYGEQGMTLQEGQLLFNLGLIWAHEKQPEAALEAFAAARERALSLNDTASVLEIDARMAAVECSSRAEPCDR